MTTRETTMLCAARARLARPALLAAGMSCAERSTRTSRAVACESPPPPLSSLAFVYFPVRALAEAARMVLEYGGVPYTDLSTKEYWGEEGWKAGKPKTAFGQLPLLCVGGRELYQTGAIVRYCASLVPSLVPTDAFEAARTDALYEASEELSAVNPIVNVWRGEKFEAKRAEFFELFPRKCANLALLLCDGPFFCGAAPTYADFALYHVFDQARLLEPSALDAHPSVLRFMQHVEALPRIREYLAARPKPIDIGTKPMLAPHIVGSRCAQAERR